MLDGFGPLGELRDLSLNLVLVVLLALDRVFQLLDLLLVLLNHLIVLAVQFIDLKELILLLGSELLFVFHLELVSHTLAILVHALHILELLLEV